MAVLRCVDGSELSVHAVACRDRTGRPYEVTLRLARNSVPFAAVGERCGYQLAELSARISAARADAERAAAWPDPDDRFPDAAGLAGGAAGSPGPAAGADAASCLPGDQEYFALRSRDPGDLPGAGELRCVLRSSALWLGECMGAGPHRQQAPPGAHATGIPGQRSWSGRRPAGGHGSWRLTRRAVIEAWGAGGVGVRAVLTSGELMAFLDTVLTESDGEVPVSPAGLAAAGSGDGGPDSLRQR